MIGTFPGKLALAEGEEVDVDLEVAGGRLRLTTGVSEIGSWPTESCAITPTNESAYQLTLDGELVFFRPDHPDAFAAVVGGGSPEPVTEVHGYDLEAALDQVLGGGDDYASIVPDESADDIAVTLEALFATAYPEFDATDDLEETEDDLSAPDVHPVPVEPFDPQPIEPAARFDARTTGFEPPRTEPVPSDVDDPWAVPSGAGPAMFSDPGFSDPGFSDPGFSDPGFSDPGLSDPGGGTDAFGRSPSTTDVPEWQPESPSIEEPAEDHSAPSMDVPAGDALAGDPYATAEAVEPDHAAVTRYTGDVEHDIHADEFDDVDDGQADDELVHAEAAFDGDVAGADEPMHGTAVADESGAEESGAEESGAEEFGAEEFGADEFGDDESDRDALDVLPDEYRADEPAAFGATSAGYGGTTFDRHHGDDRYADEFASERERYAQRGYERGVGHDDELHPAASFDLDGAVSGVGYLDQPVVEAVEPEAVAVRPQRSGMFSRTASERFASVAGAMRERAVDRGDGGGSGGGDDDDDMSVADQIMASQEHLRSGASVNRITPALVKKVTVVMVVLFVITGLVLSTPTVIRYLVDQVEGQQAQTTATTTPDATTIPDEPDPAVGASPTTVAPSEPEMPSFLATAVFDLEPAGFVERWDSIAARVSDQILIEDLRPDTLGLGFTEYLGLEVSFDEDGTMGSYRVVLDPRGDTNDDALGIQALGVAINVAEPDLDGADLRATLAELGLDVEHPDPAEELNGTTKHDGLGYQLFYDAGRELIILNVLPASALPAVDETTASTSDDG